MIERFNPGHHDYIRPSELEELQDVNQRELEKKYQDDLRIFRANVFQKMHQDKALYDGQGFAYFNEFVGSNETQELHKATLVNVRLIPGTDEAGTTLTIPRIRFIVNEPVIHGNGVQWLTYDFIADEEDDTQYFVDAYDAMNEEISEVNAPIISISDRQTITIDNHRQFTRNPSLHSDLGEDSVKPFGHYFHLTDRIDALAFGNEIWASISNISPLYVAKRPENS